LNSSTDVLYTAVAELSKRRKNTEKTKKFKSEN